MQEFAEGNDADELAAVIRILVRLAAAIERDLGTLPGTEGELLSQWVAALKLGSEENLQALQDQARQLGQSGIDTSTVEEFLCEASAAFIAPSLCLSCVTSPAVALLVLRILTSIHGVLECVEAISRERDSQPVAARAAHLANLLSPAIMRAVPYDSPAAYRPAFAALTTFKEVPNQSPDSPSHTASDWPESVPRRAKYTNERPHPGADPRPFESEHATRGGEFLEPPSSATGELMITTPVRAGLDTESSFDPNGRTHRVYFGTERTLLDARDPSRGYGEIAGNELHLGSCLVFVPRSHQVGQLGSSWVVRTLWGRGNDRVTLKSTRPLSPDDFIGGIANTLSARKGLRTALVYVHGYNTSFEQAARRAAQLACDLSVDGVTAFYSWASAGRVLGYATDEETVRLAVPPFLQFLETLQAVRGLERIDFIVHSMGSRLVAAAIKELASARRSIPIGHLVLAAPDLARAEFNAQFPQYVAVANRVTLYSCAKDKPLALSTGLHRHLRLGFEPPVFCRQGVDTVSASRLRLDWLAHGFVVSAKAVIADMKALLWQDLPPSRRNLLAVPDVDTAEYWIIQGIG